MFSYFSVSAIPSLFPPLAQLRHLQPYLPEWTYTLTFAGLTPAQWLGLVAEVLVAIVLGEVLQTIALYLVGAVGKRARRLRDDRLVAALCGPLRLFLVLFMLSLLLPLLELDTQAHDFLRSLLTCGLIIAATWLLLRLLALGARSIVDRFTVGLAQTPQVRAIHTQVSMVHTIVRFVLIVAAAALVMMQFSVARSVGLSLLASAGIVGIAVGFAAQKTVATLFAGLQLAFTRIIKIGDEVIVEGQFGTVEEIRLTYVVIKVWDLRRLIIPVTYFVEKPIENWTATSTELMGTVFLHMDYTVPVEEIRVELKNILDSTDLWDGRVQAVQVTDLTASAVEVRILVSATTSGNLWDLRCLIRERMLTWLQTRGKEHLPVKRMEVLGKQTEEEEKK